MFVTKKQHRAEIDLLSNELRFLDNRYWDLRRSYNTLLEHFGLTEVKVPEKTVLRSKDGPEESDT